MGWFEQRIKALLDGMTDTRTKTLHDGGEAASGYKPDRVYQKGKNVWVVEIESTTSRKGFIGGYLKAQKYFDDEFSGRGKLLFILNREKRNRDAITRQIDHYHRWLKGRGIAVQPTYLIDDHHLKQLKRRKVELLSKEFTAAATAIR